jgi:RNA polymerase sigma-70 factor (ECF subfamily)
VFTLAVRVVGDAADAEEVTQDVFEQVWRSAHRFDPACGSAGRWIITIAYHVAMTALRRHYRRPQTWHTDDTDRLVARIPDDARAVSAVALDRLEAQQLWRAVRSLPTPQQHAVALAYFGDLSHADVAAVLGTPLGTVKSNIRRGLTRLRPTVAGLGLVPDHEDTAEQV